MSEQKLVPELRFPEFEGDWESKTLGDITRIIDCKHRTPPYVEVGIPVVSPGSIRWGALDLESPVKRVSNKEYQSLMDHCDPKVGDLVFSRNQSLGIASYVPTDSPFVLGQDTVLIQSVRDSGFIYYWLQRQKVQNYITSLSGGSTFSRINLSDIRQLDIKTSTEDEQQKIADFLSSVDFKLAKLSRKKELLEDYKRGLMQQIFCQKLRFKQDNGSEFPEWEVNTLSNIAEITMGTSPSSKAYNDKGIGLPLLQGNADIKNRRSSPRNYTAEITRECYPEDILFSVRAPVGEVAISDHHACIGRGIASIRSLEKVKMKYLWHVLVWQEAQWKSVSQGSTFESVNSNEIKQLKLKVPKLLEQQKIADFLSSIDKRIDVVAKQIEQFETFKKGLLQKLFV